MTRPRAPAPLLVLGAIASVQTGAALATGLFGTVGPFGAVLLRLGLSALLLGVAVRPRLRSYARGTLLLTVAFGLVLAAMNTSFYAAIDRIPLGVAVTLEFVGPLGVAVAGSRTRWDGLWAALAAGGVVLLTSGGGRLPVPGMLLALLAGAFWAGYILLSQRVGRAIPGVAGLALALGVGTVALLPMGLLAGGARLGHGDVLARGFGVAMLSSAIPYSLELAALRRLRASVFGVLMSLEPAVAALSGFALLGQALSVREWVALGLVTVASVGATRSGPPAAAEPGTGAVDLGPGDTG